MRVFSMTRGGLCWILSQNYTVNIKPPEQIFVIERKGVGFLQSTHTQFGETLS